MTNLINKKALNSVQKELNNKSLKIGVLSGNFANFGTLRGCNLAGNSLLQVFFCSFLYACLDCTNEQNLMMQSLQLLNLDFLFWFTFLPIYANRKMLFLFSSLSSATNKSSICVLKLWKFAKKTRKHYKLSTVKWPNSKFFLISNTQKKIELWVAFSYNKKLSIPLSFGIIQNEVSVKPEIKLTHSKE